jgi:hypothetical protein
MNLTQHQLKLISIMTIFQFLFSFELGVIFHDDSNESEIAFRYAIKRINMYESGFELEPLIRYASTYDSFKTERIGKENLLSGRSAYGIYYEGISYINMTSFVND